MNRSWLIVLLFSFIMGMGLGESIYRGLLHSLSDSVPLKWEKEPNTIPYKLSDLQGVEDIRAGEWALDFYRGMYPTQQTTSLSIKARIPESAQIEAWLSAPPNKQFSCRGHQCGNQVGLGVLVERIGEPSVTVVNRKYVQNRWKESQLQCSLPPITSEELDLSMEFSNGTLTISVNDASCSVHTQLGVTPPLLRPGIRKIYIQEIQWSGPPPQPPTPFSRSLLWILTGTISSLWVFWERKRNIHIVTSIVGGLLLGCSWYLVGCNLKGWLESMRAAWIPWQWIPFLVPCLSSIFFRSTIESFRFLKSNTNAVSPWILFALSSVLVQWAPPLSNSWERVLAAIIVFSTPWLMQFLMHFLLSRQDRGGLLMGIWGLSSLFCIGLTNPLHIWGSVWFYMAGISWAFLIWANKNAQRIRMYNILCLIASILLICSMEGMLRGSKAGLQWSNQGAQTEVNDIFGWISTANEDFALLEEGKHTSYPSRGYPVSFQSHKRQKRIVAFGGSTTGGAFQNDDIKQFYPAKLEKLLPNTWEVINQGVGGWTSWHIQEYAQRKHELLSPDIVTLYIGHNDLLTFTPIPYAQLYAQWRSNPNAKSLSTLLGQFRLYHALRHFLVSLRPAKQLAAVPISHAQQNIENIIKLFGSTTSIVLMSEGLAPDPSPLQEYNSMMEKIAEHYPNVYYVDVAQTLHQYPSTDMYLDDCHLTSAGHNVVAEEMYKVLSTKGLLEAP